MFRYIIETWEACVQVWGRACGVNSAFGYALNALFFLNMRRYFPERKDLREGRRLRKQYREPLLLRYGQVPGWWSIPENSQGVWAVSMLRCTKPRSNKSLTRSVLKRELHVQVKTFFLSDVFLFLNKSSSFAAL